MTEVCHASGFGNLSHFGRAFRSRYGVAPTALRAARQALPAPRGADSVARPGNGMTYVTRSP